MRQKLIANGCGDDINIGRYRYHFYGAYLSLNEQFIEFEVASYLPYIGSRIRYPKIYIKLPKKEGEKVLKNYYNV